MDRVVAGGNSPTRSGLWGGKTILAVIAYFGSWAILHGLWRRQDPVLRPILIAAAILAALGILGTFPIYFQAFTDKRQRCAARVRAIIRAAGRARA